MSASDVSSQPVAQSATVTKTVHRLCQKGHPLKWVTTKVRRVRIAADINTRKIDTTLTDPGDGKLFKYKTWRRLPTTGDFHDCMSLVGATILISFVLAQSFTATTPLPDISITTEQRKEQLRKQVTIKALHSDNIFGFVNTVEAA